MYKFIMHYLLVCMSGFCGRILHAHTHTRTDRRETRSLGIVYAKSHSAQADSFGALREMKPSGDRGEGCVQRAVDAVNDVKSNVNSCWPGFCCVPPVSPNPTVGLTRDTRKTAAVAIVSKISI